MILHSFCPFSISLSLSLLSFSSSFFSQFSYFSFPFDLINDILRCIHSFYFHCSNFFPYFFPIFSERTDFFFNSSVFLFLFLFYYFIFFPLLLLFFFFFCFISVHSVLDNFFTLLIIMIYFKVSTKMYVFFHFFSFHFISIFSLCIRKCSIVIASIYSFYDS